MVVTETNHMKARRVKIPKVRELKQLVDKEELKYSNHIWGKPQIDFSTFRYLRKSERLSLNALYIVEVHRVCCVCGSIRVRKACLFQGRFSWERPHWDWCYHPRIIYPKEYILSECYRLDARGKHPYLIGTGKYPCPICGNLYPTEVEAEICERRHRQEREKQKQIEKNFEIIKKLIGSRNSLAQKRIRFAAYRLYRYFNMTPWEIARSINIRELRVRNWIGQAFKEQCLKSESCIFKPLFEEQ